MAIESVSGSSQFPEPSENDGKTKNNKEKKISIFDFDGNGKITVKEQIAAFNNEVEAFYLKSKDLFDKYGFDYEAFKNKFFTKFTKIKPKNNAEIDEIDKNIQLTHIKAKQELIKKSEEYIAKELEELKEDIRCSVDILVMKFDFSEKSKQKAEELKSVIKSLLENYDSIQDWGKELLSKLDFVLSKPEINYDNKPSIELRKISKKNTSPDNNDSNREAKVHVLSQHDPADVKEGDYAISGENTYKFQEGHWIRIDK